MKCYGVMMDASGIQNYIFGTNRLAQNVGASRIVEKILEEAYLAKCLDGTVSEEDLKTWRETHQDISLLENKGVLLTYTGGGNALMVFTDEGKAVDFAKNWTFNVIRDYPGLKPITGIEAGEFDPKDFKTFRDDCWRALQREKSLNTPVMDFPRHGMTAECVFTGEAAESRKVPGGYFENEKKYISRQVQIKHDESEKLKKSSHKYGYSGEKEIPYEFEDLGGKSGDANKTLMAVVHVDGNNMGKRFENIKSLEEYRKTSVQVNSYVHKAFERLVQDFRNIQKKHADELFLPEKILIRPIILGGDDVTFVCYGLLGLWAAEKFIQHFHAVQAEEGEDVIHACAGVAVVKPTYPFARAYALAEACCSRAKDVTRKEDRSAIDYHILKSGVFSSLKDMRYAHTHGDKIELKKDNKPDQPENDSGEKNQEKEIPKNPLINRPYVLDAFSKMDDEEVYLVSWNMVKDAAMVMAKWPNSKIKQMREAVLAGKDHFQTFCSQMKRLGYPVPENVHYDGKEGVRPLDCVEFLEAYPSWLSKEDKS